MKLEDLRNIFLLDEMHFYALQMNFMKLILMYTYDLN